MSSVDLKSLSAKERDLLVARMASNDFELFWNYCWPHEPIADHHKQWHNMIALPDSKFGPGHEGDSKVLVCAPRSWAKTSWTIRQVVFEIGRNPNMLITIVTAEASLGVDILGEISQTIKRNKKVQRVFPDLKPSDPWSKTQITVGRDIIKKDASIKAAGLFSTGVGGRSDLMIFDDCTSHKTAVDQPALRESSKKIFYEVWMNFLKPNGRVIYVCTPWHILDLSMDIRHKGEFAEWWVPALDEHGNSTWPDVWSTEALEQKRKLDQRAFDHQYMLKPFSEADIVFNFDTVLLGAGDDSVPDDTWDYYFGVDLAASMDRGAAYSSIFIIGTNPNEQKPIRHVVEIVREKARAPDFMNMILEAAERYDPICIMVENNAYQQSMIDFLEATGINLPVEGHRTGTGKLDLQTGVPAIAPLFGRELFRYPVDIAHIDSGCDCNICQWLEEMKMFPSGKTSDTVMAMWLAERALSFSRDFITGYVMPAVSTEEDFKDEDYSDDSYDYSDELDEQGSMVDWL